MSIENLKKKLKHTMHRTRTRYRYYEQKNAVQDLGISTPPRLRNLTSCLGWCGKAVDSIADRLIFDGFSNDVYQFNAIFNDNNKDVLIDSACLSALINACSFVYVTTVNGEPRMRVIDGMHATGEIDPITHMLTEGYAILDYDDNGRPLTEVYCRAGSTDVYRNGIYVETIDNASPYPQLVPIIYKPDAVRPFGHSRISRACMSLVQGAARTVKRSEIAAEFYSFPQKYAVGLSREAQDGLDKWAAAMSAMFTVTADSDGNKPQIGQFTVGSMEPHLKQLEMFASLFSSETGLTLEDLGFSGANPSSAEAIKATHETLRLQTRKAQRDFAIGLKNVGLVAACLRDDTAYSRQALQEVNVMWQPIFEPDYAALASIGDALYKISQVAPDYIGEDMIQQLTGLKPKEKHEDIFDPARIDEELENA